MLLLALAGCSSAPRAPDGRPRPVAVAPSTATASTELDVFIDAATAMVGQPYRWGGSAPGGFDCSGLVAYAAALAQIPVPRTAHEQMQAGLAASRASVDKGDLVFMRLQRKELHVGIAIDHTHFVHAPSAGGFVRIDSLDAAPYAQGFVTARHLLVAARDAPQQP